VAFEVRILCRKVGPEMGSSALRSDEGALGDESGDEVPAVEQRLETGGVANESGAGPEGAAQIRGDGLGSRRLRRGRQPLGDRRLRSRGICCPAPEDEALEQRV
jgi:hypothetical protein